MPSASASSAPDSAHNSSSWYQSLPERARRDISMPSTSPTCPMVISVTSRWNPTRPAALDPDLPWSSSITSTREVGQPNPTARSTSPYCSRVDSPWSSTCWRVDWRTYTTASRSSCRSPTLLPSRSHGNSAVPGVMPPSFTGQIPDVDARHAHARQPHRHHAAGQHRQPPHRRPAVGLRQLRPALLGRPLWGQGLPPSSMTTRPPRHAHGLAAARRPRPAAAAPHVRVSAFVLPGQHSWVHSAWRIEERFQTGKGLCGLDSHQVRRWRSWYRWTTLAMLAHAFLVVAALTDRTRHPPPTR